MASLEIDRSPENRRRYEYLAGRVNIDGVDYYVPAALRRNFGFPIDFAASVVPSDEGGGVSRTRFDVMTDGSETAAKIAEISELVRINSGVSMVDSAYKGNAEKVFPIAKSLFREQFMKVPRLEQKPSLASEDIYRLFVTAFRKKYLDEKDRSRTANTRIDNEEMRHFYNGLVNEFGIKPMDGERVIVIVSAMIKNILDIEPGLGVRDIRIQQG